jgi:hypothetical protein
VWHDSASHSQAPQEQNIFMLRLCAILSVVVDVSVATWMTC